MSTRCDPTHRREGAVRTLALGAVAVALAALLVSSGQHSVAVAGSAADHAAMDHAAPVSAVAPAVPPAVTVGAARRPHPASGAPIGLRVPALDVDAVVVATDLRGGVLVPPSDPLVLGWWVAGARPGATAGTVVLAGHTVSTGGGALDDLHLLRQGDAIRVTTGQGRIDYRVTRTRTFAKGDLAEASGRVFRQDGPGRLAVVTCTGFDGQKYVANTVVTAAPVR